MRFLLSSLLPVHAAVKPTFSASNLHIGGVVSLELSQLTSIRTCQGGKRLEIECLAGFCLGRGQTSVIALIKILPR